MKRNLALLLQTGKRIGQRLTGASPVTITATIIVGSPLISGEFTIVKGVNKVQVDRVVKTFLR